MKPKITLHLQIATKKKNLPSRKMFSQWLSTTLKKLKKNRTIELSIRIVNNAESKQLNEYYRHKKGPTNVLSFPWIDLPGTHSDYLGDLIICAPLVAQEALAQNKMIEAHWAHLVIHGLLHLYGYDHVKKPEAARMEKLETDILKELDYPNPY